MWWIITCVCVIGFIILLWIRVSVHIHFTYQKEKQVIDVTLYVYRMCIMKKHINLLDEGEEFDFFDVVINKFKNKSISEGLSELKLLGRELIQTLFHASHILYALFKKSSLRKLNWQTYLGTGVASSTGLIAGGLWALKGYFIRLILHDQHVDCQPNINIHPLFQQRELRIKISCIVSIRIGQAIYTFLKEIRKKPIQTNIISTIKGGS